MSPATLRVAVAISVHQFAGTRKQAYRFKFADHRLSLFLPFPHTPQAHLHVIVSVSFFRFYWLLKVCFFFVLHFFLFFRLRGFGSGFDFDFEQNMVKAVDERGTEIRVKLSAIANAGHGFMWNDAYASQRLDRMSQVTSSVR